MDTEISLIKKRATKILSYRGTTHNEQCQLWNVYARRNGLTELKPYIHRRVYNFISSLIRGD